MIRFLRSARSSRFLAATLVSLIILDLAVLVNVPILRQLAGFVFVTFVPGFLIVAALKLKRLGVTEKIVISVGLSISFTMLFELILNYLLLAVGFTRLLSPVPLLAAFNIAVLILAVFVHAWNPDFAVHLPAIGLTTREKALLIVPSLFPLLSISGMRLMNVARDNSILMFLLFLIPAWVIFVTIYHNRVPERLYPAFAYLIGISLVLLLALRSNHLAGSDVHESYYAFQATLSQMYWRLTTPSLINSLLSVSLLPSTYQVFMNINPEYLFKLLYPIIFSFSPLVVFVIARKYVGSLYAFLASFYFMSQFYFLWAETASQTVLAIFFFSLAVMVHFHDNVDEFARRLFFLLFAVACVVSHYSTSYIFFILLTITWFGTELLNWLHIFLKSRFGSSRDASAAEKRDAVSSQGEALTAAPQDSGASRGSHVPSPVSVTIILLFFVVIFLWHAQITSYAFDTAVGLLARTFRSMNQSLLVEAKGSEVVGALDPSALGTVPQRIRFVFDWITVIFVAIGGLSIAARYRRTVAYPDSNYPKATSLESKFELEYFVLSGVSGAILAGAVLLPFVSLAYSMERTFFQLLVVLSPYFIICCVMIARGLRLRPYLIILPILIPFFMSISGTTYQLFGLPASLLLNSTGQEYEHWYVSDEVSYAARWLAQYGTGGLVHTDYDLGPRILASQGHLPVTNSFGDLILDVRRGNTISGYVFLFYPRVIKGEVPLSKYAKMNISALPKLLTPRSELFTDGTTEIYR